MKTRNGSGGVAYSVFNLDASLEGWVVCTTSRPFYPPPPWGGGRDAVPIVLEAGWTSVPVWTGAENLPPAFDPRTSQVHRLETVIRRTIGNL